MRIAHISDIHLSAENLTDLRNFYIEALINDLEKFNQEKRIDVILITGDLVDKGGSSFGHDVYETFDREFIRPIISRIGISKDKILFIAGNHDIDTGLIDKESEFYWSNNATTALVNDKVAALRGTYGSLNKRIERFKRFEESFHSEDSSYHFSNFESLSVQNFGDLKVGFALFNDSWRCSPMLPEGKLFMGTSQLFNANKYFKSQNTDLNIAVIHHPIESFNEAESQEIENILRSFQFQILVSGHIHKSKFEVRFSSIGGYMMLGGRAAFNDPNEIDSRYQPGYSILDLKIPEKRYTVHARKFIKHSGFRFDKDVDSLLDGTDTGSYAKVENLHSLYNKGSQNLSDLPTGYKADVEKIVSLLIGKSLYPDPLVFVRELIQNSVDACDRKARIGNGVSPRIVVHFNSIEGYLEVNDEGDGMTKAILANHFSVVGKSISQEINESNGQFDLISKFGIGFISTFIAANRVLVSTKTVEDGLISLEIKNVFKDFNYIPVQNSVFLDTIETGTSIRAYLKNEYKINDLLYIARRYCRHIPNVELYRDSIKQEFIESWNVERGSYLIHEKNTKYELKLSISQEPGLIIASNSGFLISEYPQNIIPAYFPAHLVGEINFTPKSIDFDLSRANIMNTDKSKEVMKQMSVYLKYFFRAVLESRDKNLTSLVALYLQFYLVNFEKNHSEVSQSYLDFYSKDEIIRLCLESLRFTYDTRELSLGYIFEELRKQGISNIYFTHSQPRTDLEIAIFRYLQDRGNFIAVDSKNYVSFRTRQESFNSIQALSIIALATGFSITEIGNSMTSILEEMKSTNINLGGKLEEVITVLQQSEDITIRMTELGSITNAFIKYGSFFFVNRNNTSFLDLVHQSDHLTIDVIEVYMRGMLGLPLRS